ncbi:ROK family protein [Candidatus Woesearchaeota archaeon]|nr:ROK family protein [Candidatus Woesearchaeota archaeon]
MRNHCQSFLHDLIEKFLTNKSFHNKMILGIDIGGTTLKAGLVKDKRIIRKKTIKTGSTKKDIIDNLLDLTDSLFEKNISHIGIGCPGPADYKKGIIGDTPNLPLKGTNLKKLIRQRFRKKVLISNDAACFALGESIRLKKSNLVALTLGTGIGGGIIIDKKIYSGKGNAGEMGHTTINFKGPNSINHGDLESYISAKAIERDYNLPPEKLKSKKAWNEIGEKLGIGIANIINSLDPEIIVLGGGISNSFSLFRKGMQKQITERAISKTRTIKGKQESGILGAALQ